MRHDPAAVISQYVLIDVFLLFLNTRKPPLNATFRGHIVYYTTKIR